MLLLVVAGVLLVVAGDVVVVFVADGFAFIFPVPVAYAAPVARAMAGTNRPATILVLNDCLTGFSF
jgi:hypothetical protein